MCNSADVFSPFPPQDKLKQLYASEHEKLDKEIAEFEAAHPQTQQAAVERDKGEPKDVDGDKGEPKDVDGDKGEPKDVDGDKGEPKGVNGDKGEPDIDGDKDKANSTDETSVEEKQSD